MIADRAAEEFGLDAVLRDERGDLGVPPDFPVLPHGGPVQSSESVSDVLKHIPVTSFGYVFIRPDLLDEGRRWLEANREDLTAEARETDEEERV